MSSISDNSNTTFCINNYPITIQKISKEIIEKEYDKDGKLTKEVITREYEHVPNYVYPYIYTYPYPSITCTLSNSNC